MILAADEVRHYDVPVQYEGDYSLYESELLCLWAISPDEIVDTWSWDEVERSISGGGSYEGWVEEVAEKGCLHEKESLMARDRF